MFWFNRSYMRHEMNRNQTKDHNMGSYRINEIYFSSYDDKKYILEDGYRWQQRDSNPQPLST